jgi:hypothetical protein
MRRVLRGVAEGEDDLGDTSTLADPSVVDDLKEARSLSLRERQESPRTGAGLSRLRPDPCPPEPPDRYATYMIC